MIERIISQANLQTQKGKQLFMYVLKWSIKGKGSEKVTMERLSITLQRRTEIKTGIILEARPEAPENK